MGLNCGWVESEILWFCHRVSFSTSWPMQQRSCCNLSPPWGKRLPGVGMAYLMPHGHLWKGRRATVQSDSLKRCVSQLWHSEKPRRALHVFQHPNSYCSVVSMVPEQWQAARWTSEEYFTAPHFSAGFCSFQPLWLPKRTRLARCPSGHWEEGSLTGCCNSLLPDL